MTRTQKQLQILGQNEGSRETGTSLMRTRTLTCNTQSMILYFSGTGNSLRVAEKISTLLHEQLYSMEKGIDSLPSLSDNEPLGFVFPVYAWGLPRIVAQFISKIHTGSRYLWAVMTCGDDMGYADEILQKQLHSKLNAVFSVQMPNTYVCLPGFDVDSPELAHKKVSDTGARIPLIAQRIANREDCSELIRGDMPWLKTYVLRPLFNKFLVTDKYFKTTSRCTSCGLCAMNCPLKDINMESGRPSWDNQRCTGCLRCYHKCPKRAIEWGRYTKGKGQK